MSESFADLLDESIASLEMQPGSIVSGVVLDIDKNWVTVHVGLKSEGVISIDEFRTNDGQLNIEVGDQIEVALEAVEDGYGETRISREKARKISTWKNLEHALETGEFVTGKILNRVKGGFAVEVDVVKAFLPGSLVDTRPLKEAPNIENTIQDFKVIKLDYKRNNVVLSRKAVLEEANSAEKLELLKNLEEGQIVKGIVKNITDYGAFIDLGLKQIQNDPWEEIDSKYSSGGIYEAVVSNVTDYGCFAELEQGIEGLIHLSELDWTSKNIHPSKVVSQDEKIKVMILEIDREKRRISLGLKQTKPNPWVEFDNKYNLGDNVEGEIKSITDFGIFVGLEGNIDGLIHLSDISEEDNAKEALEKFSKKYVRPRKFVNPKTKEVSYLGETETIHFKPSKKLTKIL